MSAKKTLTVVSSTATAKYFWSCEKLTRTTLLHRCRPLARADIRADVCAVGNEFKLPELDRLVGAASDKARLNVQRPVGASSISSIMCAESRECDSHLHMSRSSCCRENVTEKIRLCFSFLFLLSLLPPFHLPELDTTLPVASSNDHAVRPHRHARNPILVCSVAKLDNLLACLRVVAGKGEIKKRESRINFYKKKMERGSVCR